MFLDFTLKWRYCHHTYSNKPITVFKCFNDIFVNELNSHFTIMTFIHYCDIRSRTVLHNSYHKVSQSVPFFMHCKTVTILTADSTGSAFWASSEISMAECGSCGKSRGGIHWKISSTFIVHHIYFWHERTTVTPETSQNTVLVWFYLTLCYLLPTATCVSRNKDRHLVSN